MILLPLAGCGGTSKTQSAASSSLQTTTLGQTVVKFSGQIKPMATTSGGLVSVAGLTSSSSISSVTLNPTASLNSTSLLFTRIGGEGEEIMSTPYSGGPESVVSKTTDLSEGAVLSSQGLIAYVQAGNLWTVKPDGTAAKQLTTTGSVTAPTFSPGGATIAYEYAQGAIYTIASTGGTPTKVYTAPSTLYYQTLSWSPDGTKIAFSMIAGSEYNIFTIPAAGGSATNVTPSVYTNYGWANPCWSPDGKTIAASEVAPGATVLGIATFSIADQSTLFLTPTANDDQYPAFSPDGTKIAFYRSNAGGATPGLYVTDFYGTDTELLYPDPSSSGQLTGGLISLCWSPFLQTNKQMIGSNGSLYSGSVTGFLLTQTGSQFGSMFSFVATTPSSATISSPTTTGYQPLIFNITADAITNVAWTNSYYGLRLTSTYAATPTVLVSIDATTGAVDSIAEAAVPLKNPQVSGTSAVYTGKFTAVYDATGKNVAPTGAGRVELNTKTGKLVSFK